MAERADAVREQQLRVAAELRRLRERPRLPRTGARVGAPEVVLAHLATDLAGVDRVAVVLGSSLDGRRPLRGSDPELVRWGDAQQSVAEGPVADALRTGCPVWVGELPDAGTRWPVLTATTTPRFRSYGVVPVLTHPHTVGGSQVLGTLEVASDTAHALPPSRRGVVVDLAPLLASTLLARDPDVVLTGALPDDLPVAVGILRARLAIDAPEALARMRAEAFSGSRTVHQVAHRLVHDDEWPGPDAGHV